MEPKSTYVVRHVLIKVELRLYAHCPRSTVMTQAHVMSGFGPTPIDARWVAVVLPQLWCDRSVHPAVLMSGACVGLVGNGWVTQN